MTDFTLTEGERNHPLWHRLVAEFKARITHARVQNDSTALTEYETAALRGQIRTLKGLIALGDEITGL